LVWGVGAQQSTSGYANEVIVMVGDWPLRAWGYGCEEYQGENLGEMVEGKERDGDNAVFLGDMQMDRGRREERNRRG
jgi:hypothetical protein